FDSDEPASIYLQKTQGIERSNALIRQGIPVWFWSLRWFKELDKEGFYCALDPANGQIVRFEHFVLDETAGAQGTFEQAQALAERYAQALGLDLSGYELKEQNTKQQKNRTDYSFVWEKSNYVLGEARLRVGIGIYGDTLGYFSRFLDVPEAFTRELQTELSLGQVLSIATMVFMFLLFLAAIVMIIIQFKKDAVDWKFGCGFGLGIILLSAGDFFNNLPLLWSAYPDTMSLRVFFLISAGTALIAALLIGLLIFLFGSAGESLSREIFPSRMPLIEALRGKSLPVGQLVSPVVVGYSLGFLFLGYITVFYLVGTRWLHIWMPPETEYSNMLGAYLPFIYPLTIAAGAAISEEFMFRLFSISFLKKIGKFTWPAIIIPAAIWAFAHSNYPVFPAYVRGIELTVAGIVFGVVFIRYGLEAVIIAHFIIDAALVGLPLLRSTNGYFVVSGIIVVAAALIPAGWVMVRVFQAKRTAASG
ncbi:MAG: CPBP family intramembrane metalloprotease, partial [Candidatus Omnitrophica bacterium]|nr:CPBP family intramembrane metalloprotease [Candidatus Omnitrophota bacterium]